MRLGADANAIAVDEGRGHGTRQVVIGRLGEHHVEPGHLDTVDNAENGEVILGPDDGLGQSGDGEGDETGDDEGRNS